MLRVFKRKVRPVSVEKSAFHGFANPVDPSAAELRAWAYQPDSVPLQALPKDWDLLVAGDRLIPTLFELAMAPSCPARRFALHCLHIYAADAIRTNFRSHRRRRLRKLVKRAAGQGDEPMLTWAHNCQMLLTKPDLFNYPDWFEGGLVRNPRRLA
ncbi:MAG TPA: hypothetical protein VFX60_19945 [Micromonospora sp.]|nr:hypothetical protein [Micromonospora sp.]